MEKGESINQFSEEEQTERQERADGLRRELASRIQGLINDGVFTVKEGRAWTEACVDDPPEWVQEVLDSLDDFEDSGRKILTRIAEILQSPMFTDRERIMWLRYAEKASYPEMVALEGKLLRVEKARRIEREAAKPVESKGAEQVVADVRMAIRAGQLERASVLLQGLDPKLYEVSYLRLDQDLTKAKLERAYEQYEQALTAA